jgi:hypothetical protein
MEIHFHSLLTSALDVAEWSALQPSPFTPAETIAFTYWIWGWVGPNNNRDI